MRKTILTCFIISIISLIVIVPAALSAPGDVLWTQASNPSSSVDETTDVAVDGSGIYIVGLDSYLHYGNSRWRIEKRSLAGGRVSWTKTSNPSASYDWASGVAVDGSGVYIVGFDSYSGGGRWRIEKRSLTDGSVIWTQASNPSAGSDMTTGVAVDGSGVYIVGYDYYLGDSNPRWRIEKRSLMYGTNIWNKTSNPSAFYDWASGVAVDSSGVYTVGSDDYLGIYNHRWRMGKRAP